MMVNRKTVLALGAIATVGALALAGCASGGADEGGADETAGALTVWVDADRAAVLKDAAAEFESETGVKVTLVQ